MGNTGQMIEDPTVKDHYTKIPNIIVEKTTLSHAAFRLYVWYKKVCGEKKDGICWQTLSTICGGCGMNRSTTIKARRELNESGLIVVEEKKRKDGSKMIHIRIVDVWKENKLRYKIDTENQSEIGTNPVQDRDLAEYEIGTQIKTQGNKKNTMSKPNDSDGKCFSSDGRKGKRSATKFDYKASIEFHKVVSSHIKVNCTANNKQWANQFSLMRETDKVPKHDIRSAIEWYGQNIGKEYMVEAFSAAAFRKKYASGQIPAAMKRNGYNGIGSDPADPRTDCQRTVDRVLDYLKKDGTWEGDYYDPPEQPDVDRALRALGKKAGEVTSGDCMS